MKSPTLTPTQITDLLNFILGTRIYVFVVKSWNGGQCYQVEVWIDRVLRGANLIPKLKSHRLAGRHSVEAMPLVLRGLVEVGRAAKAKGAWSTA